MAYELIIGDKTFSSWSLRGWLLLRKFGLPFEERMVGLYGGTMAQDLADVAPVRLVPAMKTPEGEVIGDTLAMAETLAERHPEAGLWPGDAAARARARWLVAEMHSGYGALRGECPMQLTGVIQGFAVSPAVRADLDRIEQMWALARARFGDGGPWLFGRYSVADAFFAPVAARIAGYGLPVSDEAAAYVAAHLADPAFQEWRAAGLRETYDPHPYAQPGGFGAWPV